MEKPNISRSCREEWLVIEQKVSNVENELSEVIANESTPYEFLGFELGATPSEVKGRFTGMGRDYSDIGESFKEFSVSKFEQFDLSNFPVPNIGSDELPKLWMGSKNQVQAVVLDISGAGRGCQEGLNAWFDNLKNKGYLEYRSMEFPFRESQSFDPMTVTNLSYAFTGYCDGYKPQVIALKVFKKLSLREIAIEHIIESLPINYN